MLRSVLLAAALSSADAAIGWSCGETICAGVNTECDSQSTCTYTAVGPKSAAGDPTAWLSSEFIGLALVKESDYLTNFETSAKVIDPDDAAENGFRNVASDVAAGDSTYAFSMCGARYGNMETMGGYLGLASYLNTGTAEIETSTVPVYLSDNTAEERVASEEFGPYSAPLGPFEMCIVEPKGGKCENTRTFQPDEYKFSVFGYVKGTNWPPMPGKDGFPEFTHLGIRMKLKAENFEVQEMTLNGNKNLENIGNTDVTQMRLKVSDTDLLTIDFPTKYNVGSIASGKVEIPDATRTVKIKISAGPSTQELYIDYLFDTKDLAEAERYFIYDPDVAVLKAGDKGFDSAAPSTFGTATALVMTLLAALQL